MAISDLLINWLQNKILFIQNKIIKRWVPLIYQGLVSVETDPRRYFTTKQKTFNNFFTVNDWFAICDDSRLHFFIFQLNSIKAH